MTLSENTLQQITRLRLDKARPLLLCDVDEVVVHFLKGLESWLDRNGLWLDPASFALNGNIKHKHDNQPLEEGKVGPAIMSFFEEFTQSLDAIEGAVPALNALAEHGDIVMLSNLPSQFKQDRITNLASHGLTFPLVTNSGPKGPAVAAIAAQHVGPVVFIDDHTGYLKSAFDHLPATNLVHFMQDERFGRHVNHEDYIHYRTDNWTDAHRHIEAVFSGAGVKN
jgi:hypothetical protein